MQARHLIMALRAGDHRQIMQAASLMAANFAAEGGPARRTERAVLDLAGRLAERTGEVEDAAFYRGTRGAGLFLRGRWREALRLLDEAYESYPHQRAGWHANAKLFATYALFYLGDLRELSRRATRLLAEAEQRNDLYVVVNLRTTSMVDLALAADDPVTAREHVKEAMDQWSQSGFLVQHWKAMVWSAEIELYAGDGVGACSILERDGAALKKSFLLNIQFVRATTAFVRGRSLVAAAPASGQPAWFLAAARRVAKRLERERMPWTVPLGAIVAAAAANAAGERGSALSFLEEAIHGADIADMALYAWAARYRYGMLLGGPEGKKRTLRAEEWLTGVGIRAPGRFARQILPGRWGDEDGNEERLLGEALRSDTDR
jgi:tetratricopeptide (TPR) repeat protein